MAKQSKKLKSKPELSKEPEEPGASQHKKPRKRKYTEDEPAPTPRPKKVPTKGSAAPPGDLPRRRKKANKGIGTGNHNNHTGPTRTPEQRELDRAEMIKLMRRGWTRQAIADKFGVHQTTICHDWKKVLHAIQDELKDEGELAVTGLIARNAEVEVEAWNAWDRSIQPHHKRVVEHTDSGGENSSPRTRVQDTTELQSGDPRFLQIVQNCHETERELRGLTAPTQFDVNVQFPWDAVAGVAQAHELLSRLPDGRMKDPFGDAIAQALGNAGMPPAPEVLPTPPPAHAKVVATD